MVLGNHAAILEENPKVELLEFRNQTVNVQLEQKRRLSATLSYALLDVKPPRGAAIDQNRALVAGVECSEGMPKLALHTRLPQLEQQPFPPDGVEGFTHVQEEEERILSRPFAPVQSLHEHKQVVLASPAPCESSLFGRHLQVRLESVDNNPAEHLPDDVKKRNTTVVAGIRPVAVFEEKDHEGLSPRRRNRRVINHPVKE